MRLHEVVSIYGSKTNIAKALGISTSSINRWRAERKIPILRQYQLKHLHPHLKISGEK